MVHYPVFFCVLKILAPDTSCIQFSITIFYALEIKCKRNTPVTDNRNRSIFMKYLIISNVYYFPLLPFFISFGLKPLEIRSFLNLASILASCLASLAEIGRVGTLDVADCEGALW